jgi:hypothetical protein
MNLIEKIPKLGVDVERLRLCEVLLESIDCRSMEGGRRFKAEESWLTRVTLVEKIPNPGGDAGDWPPCEVPLLTVRGGWVERRAGVNAGECWLPVHELTCAYKINP